MSQKHTGLLLDHPAVLESLPDFETLFGTDAAQAQLSWSAFMPAFRNQGSSYWCTAFAMCNIGGAFDRVENRGDSHHVFSPFELFYRSGGSEWGNTLVAAGSAAKDGFCLESDKPTPMPNSWGVSVNKAYQAKAKVDPFFIKSEFAIKSLTLVTPSKTMLKAALKQSPLMIAIGIGSGYWADPAPRQTKYAAYHAVVLVDILEDGSYLIFDSLAGTANFDGFHRLASDYEILYALSFVDLPNDWQDVQNVKKLEQYANALTHYGQRRDLQKEVAKAEQFRNLLKSHPTLQAGAGKAWTVLVNALTYGGYSFQDILNHLTSLRRTNSPIFDLDKARF